MLKKTLAMFCLLVVFLTAGQQVSAYFDVCEDLGNGVRLHKISEDEGQLIYSELQNADGSVTPLGGEIPEDYIIKPNGDVIDIWTEVNSIRLLNPGMSLATIMADFVPVEDMGDTVIYRENQCGDSSIPRTARVFYFDCSNTFKYDPTSFIANISIIQNGGTISVNTNQLVSVKLIDNVTGVLLQNMPISSLTNIPTSNLSVGCRYNIIVEQVINGKTCIIRQQNFCIYP